MLVHPWPNGLDHAKVIKLVKCAVCAEGHFVVLHDLYSSLKSSKGIICVHFMASNRMSCSRPGTHQNRGSCCERFCAGIQVAYKLHVGLMLSTITGQVKGLSAAVEGVVWTASCDGVGCAGVVQR